MTSLSWRADPFEPGGLNYTDSPLAGRIYAVIRPWNDGQWAFSGRGFSGICNTVPEAKSRAEVKVSELKAKPINRRDEESD